MYVPVCHVKTTETETWLSVDRRSASAIGRVDLIEIGNAANPNDGEILQWWKTRKTKLKTPPRSKTQRARAESGKPLPEIARPHLQPPAIRAQPSLGIPSADSNSGSRAKTRLPKLQPLGEVPPPPGSLPVDTVNRYDFESPDQRRVLSFHSPREVRMGVDCWRLSILENGTDKTLEHKALVGREGANWLRVSPYLQPWGWDSETIAVLDWGHSLNIYRLSSQVRRLLSLNHRPWTALWAPDRDRLLCPHVAYGELRDHTGRIIGKVQWQLADEPIVFWLNPGELFAVVGRESPKAMMQIQFYSGDDGRSVGSLPLDPRDLLPYDEAKYSRLPRDGFPLVLGKDPSQSTRAVGDLLDRWNLLKFDASSGTLLLATYRPVGNPFRYRRDRRTRHRETVCRVEQRWVGVRVNV